MSSSQTARTWDFSASGKPIDGVLETLAEIYRLSPQERRILSAATRGEATKEVASHLGISRRTVDYHWRQIFTKLGCRSQLEVMALLLRRAIDGR